MDSGDLDKVRLRQEAESARLLAIFGISLATVAAMLCTLSIPLASLYFQQLNVQMQGELDFCRLRSGNIMHEVIRPIGLTQ